MNIKGKAEKGEEVSKTSDRVMYGRGSNPNHFALIMMGKLCLAQRRCLLGMEGGIDGWMQEGREGRTNDGRMGGWIFGGWVEGRKRRRKEGIDR